MEHGLGPSPVRTPSDDDYVYKAPSDLPPAPGRRAVKASRSRLGHVS